MTYSNFKHLTVDTNDIYNEGTNSEYFYAYITDIDTSLFHVLVEKIENYCLVKKFPLAIVPRKDFSPATIDIEVHVKEFQGQDEIFMALQSIDVEIEKIV